MQAEDWMRLALEEAVKDENEVPVGAVIEKDGQWIAAAHNEREKGSCFAHAEVLAMERACEKLGTRRLSGCTLYVTLEPCPMCAGAIVQARIPRVVAGCMNPKAGCAGSVLNILNTPGLNHKVRFEKGVLEEECTKLLQDFFRELRRKGKKIEK